MSRSDQEKEVRRKLQQLLAYPRALEILRDVFADLQGLAEADYLAAANTAVFNPATRDDALYKAGVWQGYKNLYEQAIQMSQGQK